MKKVEIKLTNSFENTTLEVSLTEKEYRKLKALIEYIEEYDECWSIEGAQEVK